MCGDKIIKVGKDKKEETRPLVTISELQRMKPDEYVLVRHRCPPYKGKLKMDYNSDFGFGVGNDIYGKDVEYPQRDMDEVKVRLTPAQGMYIINLTAKEAEKVLEKSD